MGSVPFFVRRFVAGTTYQDVVPHTNSLGTQGIRTTINILGENYTTEEQIRKVHKEYLHLVHTMDSANTYLSIKLTMLGLSHSEGLTEELLHSLLQAASTRGVFVRIDMEGSAYTEKTVSIYERAKKNFTAVGIVLQAYLKRTKEDLARLQAVDAKVRLCKGAYKEPESLAYQSMAEVRKNYCDLAKILLKNFTDTAFATHDDFLIDYVRATASQCGIPSSNFEFQMLYGMRRKVWPQLRKQGYNLRVYIPFGKNWFPYFSRRLLERKENVLFVLRNIFKN